jgi:hypothetical protein
MMTAHEPAKLWWTASEIAEAGLPDMPTVRQPVEKLIMRENWRAQPAFARPRQARGGGGNITGRCSRLRRGGTC